MRAIIFLISVSVPFFACAVGHAEEEPTEEQRQLDEKAYRAMKAGDTAAAIRHYRASLEIKPLNVTYLNLGRVFQKRGECEEAWTHYDAVETAPRVSKPSPTAVHSALEKYRSELATQCPTRLEVECADPDANVSLGGGPDQPCPSDVEVSPGEHEVVVRLGPHAERKTVEAVPGRTVTVSFDKLADGDGEAPTEVASSTDVDASTTDVNPPDEDRPAPSEPTTDVRIESESDPGEPEISAVDWGALSLLAAGVTVGVASSFFDGVLPAWPPYAHNHRLDGRDFVAPAGYVVSLTMISFALWDLLDGPE